MTLKQLAEMVRDTRNAQRQYFRSRSGTDLERSKRAERALDLVVAEILTTGEQQALAFGEADR